MKTLYVISGVTGMTGSELVHQILNNPSDAESRIIGFDNFFASSIETVRDKLSDSRFIFHEWDINNPIQMKELKSEILSFKSGFETVVYINCAAVVHTEHFYEVEHTYTTNVVSMREFLHQAIEVKANVFINCSTSEVYSMQSFNEVGGVKESDYLVMATAEHSQRTSYAIGKLLTEFFMKDAVDKGLIKGCSIRFANVYSKHERFAKHIIPHIINELQNGGGIVRLLENSRINRRAFLHNIDSCSSIIELINSPEALDGTAYNVATEEEISIVDLTKLIAKKMGIKNPDIIFEGYRQSDPERRLLNTEKIRTRTKWEPKVSLSQGLDMCIKSINQ